MFILTLIFCIGCRTTVKKNNIDSLSEDDALALAVSIANEECFKRYSERPFNEESYMIKFEEGRWRWGRLDLSGEHGYSAIVSFDSNGKNKTVEVYYSTDLPKMHTR
jgi:hypothetical protein